MAADTPDGRRVRAPGGTPIPVGDVPRYGDNQLRVAVAIARAEERERWLSFAHDHAEDDEQCCLRGAAAWLEDDSEIAAPEKTRPPRLT